MSALEAFLNEQKKKAGGNAIGGSFNPFGNLRSKLTIPLSGLPLLSRSETADSESLTGELGVDGQLQNARNRKNAGWFSFGDENIFGLSRTQRIFAFFLSLVGSIFCFTTAAFLIPVIIISTRKFAALNTLGSVLLLLSFAFLWGPSAYLQHLVSQQKRLVTVCYMSSLFATLYSSLWLQSTLFTFIAAIFQAFSLIWFILSYVPGGERGLRFMSSLCAGALRKSPTAVLPI